MKNEIIITSHSELQLGDIVKRKGYREEFIVTGFVNKIPIVTLQDSIIHPREWVKIEENKAPNIVDLSQYRKDDDLPNFDINDDDDLPNFDINDDDDLPF